MSYTLVFTAEAHAFVVIQVSHARHEVGKNIDERRRTGTCRRADTVFGGNRSRDTTMERHEMVNRQQPDLTATPKTSHPTGRHSAQPKVLGPALPPA